MNPSPALPSLSRVNKMCHTAIRKFAATAPKSYFYCVKTIHEKEDLEFTSGKIGKRLVGDVLRFSDYQNCVRDTINAPITRLARFTKTGHIIFFFMNCFMQKIDKDIFNEDGTKVYHILLDQIYHSKNILMMKIYLILLKNWRKYIKISTLTMLLEKVYNNTI